MNNQECPLCASPSPDTPLSGPLDRTYLLCPNCQLIFVSKEFLPDRAIEKARYEAHQNNPQDEGYANFLKLAISPTLPYLNKSMHGLDYGCGPTPALSGLLDLQGLNCENYDPFFSPDIARKHYDFIFATEVIEHFFNPALELERITALLVPGGILTIMTDPWISPEQFVAWHYARDITHVCFYHEQTFAYICACYDFEILNHASPRVWVLKKQDNNRPLQ